ncbi:c-type cytochrome [Neptuniibacter caesariensis]|uniref:Probable sulfite oxidase cytochrome subunit n=1 Tax=Neptuniibacter caesariensis TaxID=207954 RepID=A0A7U8C3C2_NEPCE|nr:c-type cytochrome [Neptuniibacter caesariensis]EAR60698.1 probable sulfite oxidase cytochrome subunit [Neptuniibacter caesariensis]
MFKSLDNKLKKSLMALGLGAAIAASGLANAGQFNIGTTATPEEIAGWDIDIRPDGMGLPEGQGTVEAGEEQYEALCATCHGLFGEGEGRWPVLAGGQDTLTEERPTKTVGSYWPYASTLYDYIRRAMPFTAPRSLSDQQVYDITAYVLYLNEIVDEDFVLTKDNLATIEMPNQDNFFVDPRPDVKNTRCMKNCADPKKLQIAGTLRGITPVGHFVEGADAPAASHDAQMEQEHNKEKVRKASLKGEEVTSSNGGGASALSESATAGQSTYDGACKVCHGSGLTGSPKIGDIDAWAGRIKQGMPVLVEHAIKGFTGDTGVMPPKGGRVDLSDKQVEDAVAYMVESSR